MVDHVLQTLELVKEQVRDLESQLAEKKRMANSLCELADAPKLYANTDVVEQNAVLPRRGDEYYGKTMSPAIREILEARKAASLGPATVNEIHGSLVAGGYQFDAANTSNEKKSVRICLTKNSSIFHKLPGGKKFGLTKWYPNVRTPRNGSPAKSTDADESTGREIMKSEFGDITNAQPSASVEVTLDDI